ncbi:MAG: Ca2+-dependent phosphoinositide-specific phospholipase C [Pseudomonadota bacterium]
MLTGFVHADELTINQIQFVGSHNSYKQAMSAPAAWLLRLFDAQTAEQLDYAHVPLAEQLDQGLRKLELDVFYDPDNQLFVVGHVQLIDMNSHCTDLRLCLQQILRWSEANPHHVPIWIGINAKDDVISLLPDPHPFTPEVFAHLDEVLWEMLGDKLITPADVPQRRWPGLQQSRGKFLLVLDERGQKIDWYLQGWQRRPMFANAPVDHPAAAVLIVNDPVARHDEIQARIRQGYMVRTRADADTVEARSGAVQRRERAFSSGAQAVSTDYYLPHNPFGTDYRVTLPHAIRCNPVNTPPDCRVPGINAPQR